MCMCLLLLPSSDLTLGKMPPPFDPFVWSDSPKNSPWDSRISKGQEQRFNSIPPAESGWRRSVFSIYPTFCLFNVRRLQTELASKSQETSGQTPKTRDFLGLGPRPRPIIIHCHTKAPRHLGLPVGETFTGWDLPNSTLILFNRIYGIWPWFCLEIPFLEGLLL